MKKNIFNKYNFDLFEKFFYDFQKNFKDTEDLDIIALDAWEASKIVSDLVERVPARSKEAQERKDLVEFKEGLAAKYDLPVEAIPSELFDFLHIMAMGAKKYAMLNWLYEDGKTTSERDMHASMFRHLAKSLVPKELMSGSNHQYTYSIDQDSERDHLLHLACRAMMLYTRRQRGIKHSEDLR